MTKPYTCHPKFYDPLAYVMTIAEVAEHWSRHRSTIRYAIDAENLAAVQSGRTWLISLPSVAAFWGPPHPAPDRDFERFCGGENAKTPLQIIRKEGFYVARKSDSDRSNTPPHIDLRLLP